jgi:hypothetical protein
MNTFYIMGAVGSAFHYRCFVQLEDCPRPTGLLPSVSPWRIVHAE